MDVLDILSPLFWGDYVQPYNFHINDRYFLNHLEEHIILLMIYHIWDDFTTYCFDFSFELEDQLSYNF